MSTLEGRTAIVTGGGRGIGAAITRTLAVAGANVAINYRSDSAAAQSLVDELTNADHSVVAVQGDVTDPDVARELVALAVDRFGGLDIAVSNAGIEHFGSLASITPEDFQRVFTTNVAGQLFTAQAAAAAMTAGGRIVLTSSVSARIGVREHTLYAGSKAAISAMVRNLAPELGERSITINAIAPGGTDTDMAAQHGASYTHPALSNIPQDDIVRTMTSAGRFARPQEIADVVAFLVSPAASYISGSTVAIDGGWL